jgi:hypothetical protein
MLSLVCCLTIKQVKPIYVPTGFVHTSDFNAVRRDPTKQWYVSIKSGELSVVSEKQFRESESKVFRKEKFEGIKIRGESYPTRLIPRQGISVIDGYMHPVDNGEWGGGIYFENARSGKFTKISFSNTSFLTKIGSRLYAIQASAHMGFQYSQFVEIRREGKKWRQRGITDLHEVPTAYMTVGHAIVYVANNYISTLELNGTQLEIYRHQFNDIGCRSCVALPNGDLWFGCDWGLFCLKKSKSGGYEDYMFVPQKVKMTK